jgi:SAM-dependent methyltransferase
MSALAEGPANRGSVELRSHSEPFINKDKAQSLGSIYETIEMYYTAKISKYGATPLGVDWTCIATQELRFVQLLKLCDFSTPFTLNDLGCGYGALLAYLSKRHSTADINYFGVDVSPAMIVHACRFYSQRPNTSFVRGSACLRIADYSVASGIFNVKLAQEFDDWEFFIEQTLVGLKTQSRCGFSVNFMLPVRRPQVMNKMLYRTTPERWAEFCQDRLDCSVETIANYGLREFTLLVRSRKAVQLVEKG